MLGIKLQVTLAAVCTLAHTISGYGRGLVCSAVKLRYLLYPHENM